MKIIKNKLIAEDNCYIKDKNDLGQWIGDKYINPSLYKYVYLGKQIDTLDKAKEAFEELTAEDVNNQIVLYSEKLREEYEKANEQE